MTIVEAAKEALRRSKKPMTVEEIHQTIVENKLYEFKAREPRGVLRTQIRRHCEGITGRATSDAKHFRTSDSGKRYLLSGS